MPTSLPETITLNNYLAYTTADRVTAVAADLFVCGCYYCTNECVCNSCMSHRMVAINAYAARIGVNPFSILGVVTLGYQRRRQNVHAAYGVVAQALESERRDTIPTPSRNDFYSALETIRRYTTRRS